MTAARGEAATGRGVAVMCLGMLLFSIVDVLNKSLADLPVVQIIWVRFLVFMPIAAAMAWRPRRGIAWRSNRPGLQLLRSAVLVVEMGMFVWAVKLLPLADVQAISASAPLLVTALAVPLLGEQVGWRRWCAVGAAFLGVMVIVRPGFQQFDAAMLVALAGTLLWAVYQLMLRLVGREDGATTTALWSAVVGAGLTSLVAPAAWVAPDARGWALLAAVAITGSFSHTVVNKAFRLAPAATLQPFTYLMLVFATLFGWLVFGQLPDAWTVAGALVIVASGLYAFHRERVRATRVAAQP